MQPIELAREIEGRYRRYLETTFYFRDPELRSSFKGALGAGHLSRGPYLEATPVFKRGLTPRQLLPALGLQSGDGFLGALNGDRPLYQHQEEAIRRATEGHNVVIATGTASGKTEAFLYPILVHLHKQFSTEGLGPGVRALVLYPMNALANDQRERLGEICGRLEKENSQFRFTFGQYIGETPKESHDSRRNAGDHIANRLPGELVLRSEMRLNPPHILLTNYSMLEYLLLRPDDIPLFDGGRARWWTYLVLDEAHQYRGSKGIEMGMLLRRLKQRLREGGAAQPFRCIATSATLAEGQKDKAAVAQFASDLFGEEFEGEDVILGETETIPPPEPERLSREEYLALVEALKRDVLPVRAKCSEMASRLGIWSSGEETTPDLAVRILQADRRSSELRQRITDAPEQVELIARDIFNDVEASQQVQALSELVGLLLRANDAKSGAPLLSARYHLFLRSLEGAYVSYWPQKTVFLERGGHSGVAVFFEVALCRECGQHYLVGRLRDGKLQEAVRDPSDPRFGATFFRPLETDSGDVANDDSQEEVQPRNVFRLCVECGAMWKNNASQHHQPCSHGRSILVEQQKEAEEREDQIPSCSACGYRGPDPVREVIHGTDGPHAVIATTLYQMLPVTRKKVLAFADGRQEAAFFAWYLENSYKDILGRNLILEAVRDLHQHTSEGVSLGELALTLRDLYREKEIFAFAKGDLELRREAWLSLYREFLTDEPRISLEGVGLIEWGIKWPKGLAIPEVLLRPPWSFTEVEVWNVFLILLHFMRADKAVELQAESGVSIAWEDLGLQVRQKSVRIGAPKNQRGLQSWEGKSGKRARFLAKLLTGQGMPKEQALEESTQALRAIWEAFRRCDEAIPLQSRAMVPVGDARRLNPAWWRARPLAANGRFFQCDTCGRFQAMSVRGICARYNCPGHLKETPTTSFEPNHYRQLYESNLPGPLRVEEHTAQIDREKAREFQRAFKAGQIHVLSSSTTFELGVDLGNLDTVFLRNVPPEAFNYAQRVGRCGRRSGYAGFAVTYCRRSPHDLYYFADPRPMVRGSIRPPVLSLTNEKIVTRHIAAAGLSHFFRENPGRFRDVQGLLVDLARPSALRDFCEFLQTRMRELEVALAEIVPRALRTRVGLANGAWIANIAGSESKFSLAESEVSNDFQTVKTLEQRAAQKGDYDTAKWARARAATIAKEDVLSFLSRKAVIPKYGFPVDVVELDVQRTQRSSESMEVSLQRDLAIAIAEFAPTSKVVANKKLWLSYGLKKVAEKEWPRRFYRRCAQHNLFVRWSPGEAAPTERCCAMANDGPQYIVPQFGFITDRAKPKDPTGRPPKVFTTRPYFVGFKGVQPGEIDHTVVSLKKASRGSMVVLCEGRRGRAFYICGRCGAGFTGQQRRHTTPYGEDCSGCLEQFSLGHEFETDVLLIQFRLAPRPGLEPVWSAYSLAYAVVEGAAEVLEVPSADLSATVAYGSREEIPPIILYDNVPGGAGLVARLEEVEYLRNCLESAKKRVSGICGCDEGTSCYGCLRSYRNQFAHQKLQRGAAYRYLDELLQAWHSVPTIPS